MDRHWIIHSSLICNGVFAESQLKVIQLDLLEDVNKKAHRTDDYETEEMVLRRGQSFNMEVILHRDFMKGSDEIYLEFLMGKWGFFFSFFFLFFFLK